MRTEHDAAAFHGRLSDASVPCAASSLLPVRLGAAPGDGAAGLGRGGALACVVGLTHERLVHDRGVHLLGEDHLGEPDLALERAGGVEQGDVEGVGVFGPGLGGRLGLALGLGGCLRGSFDRHFAFDRLARFHGFGLLLGHQTFLPVGLPDGPFTFTFLVDWRTSTSAPFAPGTPPLTRMRFRSGSTLTTL